MPIRLLAACAFRGLEGGTLRIVVPRRVAVQTTTCESHVHRFLRSRAAVASTITAASLPHASWLCLDAADRMTTAARRFPVGYALRFRPVCNGAPPLLTSTAHEKSRRPVDA